MSSTTSTKPVDLLLIEDQSSDADLALRALDGLEYDGRVHLVEDGAEALDFVFGRNQYAGRTLAEGPRLILLDLKLPKVNGHEVLRRFKSDERTQHIPVIVLSSSKQDRDVKKCYELGANSYVVKPVDFEAFTNTMQRIGSYWLETNQEPA